jgi:hypothetical protein
MTFTLYRKMVSLTIVFLRFCALNESVREQGAENYVAVSLKMLAVHQVICATEKDHINGAGSKHVEFLKIKYFHYNSEVKGYF